MARERSEILHDRIVAPTYGLLDVVGEFEHQRDDGIAARLLLRGQHHDDEMPDRKCARRLAHGQVREGQRIRLAQRRTNWVRRRPGKL
jgi:hypothetical protein